MDLDVSARRTLRRYRDWKRFHAGPRRDAAPLLGALSRYPRAAMVAGCQRSGTTMLTRIIAASAGFRPLSLTRDDELDAALALCGAIELPVEHRYCFQTTYLNERYREYGNLRPENRLVWVVRH